MSVASSSPSSPSNVTDFAAFRAREYARTLAELRQARASLAQGPAVLALINELACLAEDILVYRSDENGQPLGACCPESDRFLARLTAATDRIARSNGQLDNAFFRLVESLPVETPRAAA